MPTNKDQLSTGDYDGIGAAVALSMQPSITSVITKLDELIAAVEAGGGDVTPVLYELQNMRLTWLWLWNHPGISFPTPPAPPPP